MEQSNETVPLRIESASKIFRQGETSVTALNQLSMEIPAGQFVAIMGASGSGKSTLMHAIAGLTDIDSGRIEVAGREIGTMSDLQLTRFRRDQIGLVFQSFNLIPALSAEKNILLPAAGLPDVEERLDVLLNQLGIQSRRHHKPAAMSGGEQQRVAIARALIRNPEILLADEPTGSLDSETGQKLCQLLRSLKEEQERTIIVVTHEPTVAMWADRVIVMKDGTSIADFQVAQHRDSVWLTRQYQQVLEETVSVS